MEGKSVVAALDSAEKQAEDQLATSKTQITTLKKKLEEIKKARELAEKAQDQAKQDGYDLGVAEAEESLKAEDSGVYMTYYSQVWTEALNQARVEVSSVLRKVESVYYPLPSEGLSPLAR